MELFTAMLTFRDKVPFWRAARTRNLADKGHEAVDPFVLDLTHSLFDGADQGRIHGPWRKLLGTEEFRYRPGLSSEERAALSYSRLRSVNKTLDSPEELPLDIQRLAALHEWAGVADGGLGTLASIHYNLFMGSLLDHRAGGPKGHDLSDYASMRRTGTFLCTELDHGNDAAALRTTAEFDRETGGFVLHTPAPGAQKFMPNTSLTGGPKTAVVMARLVVDGEDHGCFLFLTPLSDETGHLPGIHVRQLPDRTGTPMDHCLTSFDRVRLPHEALLGGEHGRLGRDGSFHSALGSARQRFLNSISRVTSGKLCMSAGAVGMARAALAIAVKHAHARHISGPKAGERVPLVAHRSHAGSLLDGIATAYAATFLQRDIVAQWAGHTPENQAEVERLVAVSKGWITWRAREITVNARERCGAQGLFPVNGISDLTSTIEGTITAEGDNLVIWVKAASEMLFEPRPVRLQPDPPAGEQLLTNVTYLRDLLVEVERDAQRRASKALRRGPMGDPLGRWNEASPAALEMVSAHAGRKAADAFIAAAARAVDPTARMLLEHLCRLFLLRQLEPHTGVLLADGHLTPDHVRGVPDAVNEVIAVLVPHMSGLVDAFCLPSEYLSSLPIAGGGLIGDQESGWSAWGP
ncbi:acyl-CoA dehydrogenase family protein [Streptomyces sp. NPDC004749]